MKSLLLLIMISAFVARARSLALALPSPRPLGSPSMIYFDDYVVLVDPAMQPKAASQAEVWTVLHLDIWTSGHSDGQCEDCPLGEQAQACGSVCFQLSDEAARVISFEIDAGDDDEEVTRFVLAALGARLERLGASIILPIEVAPMVELATEALLLEEGDAIMCCDTDGRPLLPLPAAYVQQHNLVHIGAHGTVFGAEALSQRKLRRRL
jgi:hypothetical protein